MLEENITYKLWQNYQCIPSFVVVGNTFSALEMIEFSHFELIICDKNSRCIDSNQFLKMSRKVGCFSPIVQLLDHFDAVSTSQARNYHFDDILRNPFNPKEICEIIGKVLNFDSSKSGSITTNSQHNSIPGHMSIVGQRLISNQTNQYDSHSTSVFQNGLIEKNYAETTIVGSSHDSQLTDITNKRLSEDVRLLDNPQLTNFSFNDEQGDELVRGFCEIFDDNSEDHFQLPLSRRVRPRIASPSQNTITIQNGKKQGAFKGVKLHKKKKDNDESSQSNNSAFTSHGKNRERGISDLSWDSNHFQPAVHSSFSNHLRANSAFPLNNSNAHTLPNSPDSSDSDDEHFQKDERDFLSPGFVMDIFRETPDFSKQTD